jgi:uncharacterized protein (DUF2236 family)
MVRGLTDIGAESVLLLGAGRSILLQVAYPAIGHGVADHSDFVRRPLERLRATMTYVYAVVYGSEEQLAAVRRSVNRAHARVRRPANNGSPGYSAFDAQAQLWVVATLYDTTVTVYEKIHGLLSDEAADTVYRDFARIGTVLQLPAGLWPADRSAFRTYWDGSLQRLQADATALNIADELFRPPKGPLWLRMAMPLARFLTAGFLPHQLREDFELPWSDRHRVGFEVVMRLLAVVYPRLPQRARYCVKNHYLDQLASFS